MLVTERRERILAFVRARGTAALPDLARSLDVSEMTVRRDVNQLADEGLVEKVRGGVRVFADATVRQAPVLTLSAERQAIAAAAAGLVQPGMSIGITGGATALAAAQAVTGIPDLTIVTNSVPVADMFTPPERSDAPYTQTVVLTGGVRTPSQSLVGSVAVRALEQLHCDIVFLDVHGLDIHAGMTTMNLLEAETHRAFMASARQVVALADHTRWKVVGLTTISDLSDIDVLIADDGLDQDAQALLSSHVGRLEIAEPLSDAIV